MQRPLSLRQKYGWTAKRAEDSFEAELTTDQCAVDAVSLLRRRGHRVSEVVSGEEAVLAMQQNAYDLLLTDIHMPGLDGVEATRLIRAEERECGRPRTPIVALTADVLETGKSACQDAGMDGFLPKPVDPGELDAMLASLFPSSEEESELHHAAA